MLIEIPSDPLRPLADEFRRFVDGAFDRPWPSTVCVRDYLGMDVVKTYVRGERSGHETPSWYVQSIAPNGLIV